MVPLWAEAGYEAACVSETVPDQAEITCMTGVCARLERDAREEGVEGMGVGGGAGDAAARPGNAGLLLWHKSGPRPVIVMAAAVMPV